MKRDEKQPIPWEAKDPKPPVVHSGRMENRKQNAVGLKVCTMAAAYGRRAPLCGAKHITRGEPRGMCRLYLRQVFYIGILD